MIEIKLLVMAICSALFWWGGFNFNKARRFIMPTVLALSCVYFAHTWWALTMMSAMGMFCLGYGDNSPLRHCFGNGWGRGIWGLLGAIALSLGLFMTGHIPIYFFLPYLAINFTLENALKDIPQVIGDPVIGLGFSAIVFVVS